MLLQPHRSFFQNGATAIQEAAVGLAEDETDIEVRIECLEDLLSQNTAARVLILSGACDAICITAAVYPVVVRAVETLQLRGPPVFACQQ